MEWTRCGGAETAWAAGRRGARAGSQRFRLLTAAVLVVAAACAAEAHAQSRSRADVQLGATLEEARSAVVMGGTGWITERAGVSAQIYVFSHGRPSWSSGSFETSVRQRGFVNRVEVDFGMGLMFLPPDPSIRFPGGQAVTAELLFGWRLAERLGVKAGVNFVQFVHEEGGGYFVMKCLVALPLGSL